MVTHPGITVVIPTIPPRKKLLDRAAKSVVAQTRQATEIEISVDDRKLGAAWTRQQGLVRVKTAWVAFLDDDDEFMPGHLQALTLAALDSGADYVYSWYEMIGGTDPAPKNFGKPFDPAKPVQTTITTLVRTELALDVGGFGGEPVLDPNGGRALVAGEDWRFTLNCVAAGALIHHLPVKTWYWRHHGSNTSGLPSRW